jgi:hypothetical protein
MREELAATLAQFNVVLDRYPILYLFSSCQNVRELGQPFLSVGYLLKNASSLSF